MHLHVESIRRKDRGKILLRIENMRATAEGTCVVSAFERTTRSLGYEPHRLEQIPLLWREVSVSLHDA